MEMKIKGLAVPYNVQNAYGEILLPNAFDVFLREWLASKKPLKMKAGHKVTIGQWTAFANKPKGLYLIGTIEDAEIIDILSDVEDGKQAIDFFGLSISYGDLGDGSLKSRLLRSAILDLNRGMQLHKKIIVKNASLNEVSITPDPAFPGTWIRKCG